VGTLAQKKENIMFKWLKTKLLALLGVMGFFSTQAQAALTAPDFTAAQGDVTTVVVAILGFLAVIYGFKKVIGLMGR
jgi:hypothetical protein